MNNERDIANKMDTEFLNYFLPDDSKYIWVWKAGSKPKRMLKEDVSYIHELKEEDECQNQNP